MNLFNREVFEKLAEKEEEIAVSLFIPTTRGGHEVLEGKDAIHLKNELRQAKNQLVDIFKLTEPQAESFLKPARNLMRNDEFWREQSDGLVLFISDNDMKDFSVPVNFRPEVYVSNYFYLRPLVPMVNKREKYFLMLLSQNQIKFYECTKYAITEVMIKDLVPEGMLEVVGEDYKEKTLQSRSGQGESGEAMYHGHNVANDKHNEELEKYMRAIDEGLNEMLHDENAPLVVCAVDHIFADFKKYSKYNNIFPENISGNPEHESILELHEKSVNLLKPFFNEAHQQAWKQFGENVHQENTSTSIEEILPKAINGRVETLFVGSGSDRYFGKYSRKNNTITKNKIQSPDNYELIDLAARKTIAQGGNVYIKEKANLSGHEQIMNAFLRY